LAPSGGLPVAIIFVSEIFEASIQVANKHKVTNPEVLQADGVTDDQTVTADADVAGEIPEVGISGLPMEPEEERAARLQRELDDAKDKLLRLAAEFDNFRKRVARERVELSDRAQAAFVMRMLDVLDDLDRLVAGETSAQQTGPLYDATVLINRKLRKELESAGLERIDPVGQGFDPTKHEAVSILPPPRPEQDHSVSATFQSGYAFKGSLIRPARVQVFSDQGQA
jgi:molecular chaperone GrpE